MEQIQFKRGSYQLNDDPNFNFQLNRVIQWDGGRLEDIEPIAQKIRICADWKRELIALGDRAAAENRIENAIGYYRMSEFFMFDGDPDKQRFYRKATDMFYEWTAPYFKSGAVQRLEAPYEDVKLPILYAEAIGTRKGVILLHGGNDSYLEEFFFPMLYLAQNGYAVYLFEGPGQGGVVRVQGKKFTHEWERPVKAVLDTIGERNVTIMGASLGGMLAPRAAAFDHRIRRVVGWSVFSNFLDVPLSNLPTQFRKMIRWMIRHNLRAPINHILNRKMKKDPIVDWAIHHGMYAYDAATPFDWVKKLDDYKMTDIGPKLTQDMLIIAANRDHFIPIGLLHDEIDALPNLKSLTVRILTEHEEAGGHCNVGNPKLTLDTVINWLNYLNERDETEN